jgi:hypothetical protein
MGALDYMMNMAQSGQIYQLNEELTELKQRVQNLEKWVVYLKEKDMAQQEYMYETFDDWYLEQENYGMRCERLWESMGAFKSELGQEANLLLWLRAAFESGRLLKDGQSKV